MTNRPAGTEPTHPAPRSHRRLSFGILLGLAAAAAVWSGWSIAGHLADTRRLTESSTSRLATLTTSAALSIDAILRDAMSGVDSVAAGLSTGALTRDTALARLREALEANAHFYGSTISYRPFGFDPSRRLYSAYYAKRDGRTEYVQLDEAYDYTQPDYEWFGPALAGGPLWTAPYYDEAVRTFMVTYSAPFYAADPSAARDPLGVVTVDISMDEIRRIIESLDLGPAGFGALVSQQGLYLFHPDAELVLGRKTLAEVAVERNDPDRLPPAAKAQARETGIIDHLSTTTGLSAWLSYAPVPSTGWSLQNTFIKDDLRLDVDRTRRRIMGIVIALVIFAAAAGSLLLGAHTGRIARLWAASILTAVLFAVGIGYLWKVSLMYDSPASGDGVRITDAATLNRVMNDYVRACAERHTEPPVYVPTGVFIESASFTGTNDLSVTGYLWQKYTVGDHDALSRGFVIGDATSLTVSESYLQREQDTEVVRWRFTASIRQRFDHSKYPLEQETVGLRILHQDLNHNVVLVPDLGAYTTVASTSLPGLEPEMFRPGWELIRSFFELRERRIATNFGLERSLAREDFPSLYFNFVIRRSFIDAFISNLTAVIIVTILLFTMLMIASRDERLVGFMQAGSGRVLSICAAMFFVIAFSHIDIRRKIAAEEIFYLEYFYLLVYFSMLWVAVNSVLFAMGADIRLIQYRDNLISKLLFWPVLLGLLLAVTVFTFR